MCGSALFQGCGMYGTAMESVLIEPGQILIYFNFNPYSITHTFLYTRT